MVSPDPTTADRPLDADELRAVLHAYQQVMVASWPDLHPDMARRASRWANDSPESLQRELDGYLTAASRPGQPVRIFWKLVPGFRFAGFNDQFARDAGLPADALRGSDDFDARLPWVLQAAKYRADDEAVAASGTAKLNIIERQRGSDGTITWVRVGKAPIRPPRGVIGILGMYEVLTPEEGRRLFALQGRQRS